MVPRLLSLFVSLDEDEQQAVSRMAAGAPARVLKRSLDARKGHPIGYHVQIAIGEGELPEEQALPPPARARAGLHVVVVGTGPAGTFAALRLSEAGARVTLVDAGKPVQPRRHDLASLTQRGALDPLSNYCFGEGGAGTFSDGKLYTRTKDRAAVRTVLRTLVDHGAPPSIVIDSRPHVGSNKLPAILIAMREHLARAGVHYVWSDAVSDLIVRGARGVGMPAPTGGADPIRGAVAAAQTDLMVRSSAGPPAAQTDLIVGGSAGPPTAQTDLVAGGSAGPAPAAQTDLIVGGSAGPAPAAQTDLVGGGSRVWGVVCASGREIQADAVVLATGHSARPIYQMLLARGVALEAKSFAVGARIEHPQPLIDKLQYGRAFGHPKLSAAFYEVSAKVGVPDAGERGVYSFCMCPGGWVVNASTEQGMLCTNGMSLSRRDSPWANAALVVTVEPRDYLGGYGEGPLAGMEMQRALERRAFELGGGDFVAAAQRVPDFLAARPSESAHKSNYRPSVRPGDVRGALPPFVAEAIARALRRFDKMLPGFASGQAQLVGVETRSSAPVRILRDASLQSPTHRGLYPSAEGAGYAGGIVSAAIDGLRVADAILSQS